MRGYQAPVPLTILQSYSKLDKNSKCSGLKFAQPITTKFYTCHDSVTVVTCVKYHCDRWVEYFMNKSITKFHWILNSVEKIVSGTGARIATSAMAAGWHADCLHHFNEERKCIIFFETICDGSNSWFHTAHFTLLVLWFSNLSSDWLAAVAASQSKARFENVFVFSFYRWPGRSLPWGSGSVWGLVPVIIAHQRRRPRPGTIQVSQQSFSDLLMLLNYYVSLNLPQLSQYRNHAACVLVYVQYCITSSDECDINTIETWTKCMNGHYANNTFKSILD